MAPSGATAALLPFSSVHVARRDAEALREWGEIAFGEGLPRSSASEWSEIQDRQKGVRNFASTVATSDQ
eukprot:5759227-Prymnesium_polylepis.1